MITVDIYNVFVQYELVCPKCGWTHWLTEAQYDDATYHVTCECKTRFKPNRIIPDNILNRTKKGQIANDVLKIAKLLTDMDIPLREAKIKAQQVYNDKKDISTMLREAMLLPD